MNAFTAYILNTPAQFRWEVYGLLPNGHTSFIATYHSEGVARQILAGISGDDEWLPLAGVQREERTIRERVAA